METELKLQVAQPDLSRLRQHQLLADHAHDVPTEHQLTDTYYDTPKLELWRNGVTLRVREEADTWIQTVKTASASSATLHERGEWESPLPSGQPQPVEIARQIKSEKIARLLGSPGVAQALRPIFKNTTRRTIWNLELPDGQFVECALDTGNIDCDGQTVAIGELELELKKGNPTQLFELALALHEDIPLQIANDSKAARGYALIEKQAAKPVKAVPVRLNRKMSLEDAFRCMGLNCLQQMEANVPGVLTQSVESLHQMRVGLRRLRALLDMFGELAPLPSDVREGLEWLAGELGATRDWDVLANSTLDKIAGLDTAELKALATARARELHQALLVSLRDPRYTQLVLQLNGWLHGRHWRRVTNFAENSPLSSRATDGMTPLLHKAQRRLRKRIDSLDQANPAERHRIRIAAKKARYAAEFFSDLLPGSRVKQYISSLSSLQDGLGTLNDMEVASKLLPELEKHGSSRSVGFALGYLSSASGADLPQLKKSLRSARKMKPPYEK
jgi:triphosphatase